MRVVLEIFQIQEGFAGLTSFSFNICSLHESEYEFNTSRKIVHKY